MFNCPPISGRASRRGFTLVELLTVIVIIAILIGILLPVVSKVRKSAHVATTRATINTIAAGIEAYYQTFNAYPAQLTNAAGTWTAPTVGGYTLSDQDTGGTAFTQAPSPAESLVLWMMGGLSVPTNAGSPTAFLYSRSFVGSGPVNLSPLQSFKRYKPFIGTDLKLSDGQMNADSYYASIGFNDTAVPEFLDDFPTHPMPILYLPANAGAQYVFYLNGATNPQPPSSGTDAQYDLSAANHYYGLPTNPSLSGGWNQYFGDPNSLSGGVYQQAREKDRYILISAGPDGKYGTADDITNFGTPGQ